jgi:hypothetical protein
MRQGIFANTGIGVKDNRLLTLGLRLSSGLRQRMDDGYREHKGRKTAGPVASDLHFFGPLTKAKKSCFSNSRSVLVAKDSKTIQNDGRHVKSRGVMGALRHV